MAAKKIDIMDVCTTENKIKDLSSYKKRNLNKHKNDVGRFYPNFIDRQYDDELILGYQRRFQKNKDKLFAFLNYDGIPWNNNNAEHAIKPFAYYRRDNEK